MIHKFEKSRLGSVSDCDSFPVEEHFRRYFRDYAGCRPGTGKEDRDGIDYVVRAGHGTFGVDLKVRSEDPAQWGEDDLAVELHSVLEKRIRGYQGRRTTHVMWIFKSTGRSVLIPFDVFRSVYDSCFDYWNYWLAERPQWTEQNGRKYRSTHCYVPTGVFGPYALKHRTPLGPRAEAHGRNEDATRTRPRRAATIPAQVRHAGTTSSSTFKKKGNEESAKRAEGERSRPAGHLPSSSYEKQG